MALNGSELMRQEANWKNLACKFYHKKSVNKLGLSFPSHHTKEDFFESSYMEKLPQDRLYSVDTSELGAHPPVV